MMLKNRVALKMIVKIVVHKLLKNTLNESVRTTGI